MAPMTISFTLAATQRYNKMVVPRKEQGFLNFEPKCYTVQTIRNLQMQFLMQSNPLSNLFNWTFQKCHYMKMWHYNFIH